MNRWLVTIIAGSILAGLSWFSYDLFFAPYKEKLYAATYRIRVTEDSSRKSEVPGKPVAATISILSKRLAAATYKHEIMSVTDTEGGVTLFDARISNIADTNRCKELLTRRGLLQFREMYTPQEILPTLNLADSILQAENANSKEINPNKVHAADTVAAISPEVKALLDSMIVYEQKEVLHSKGLASILQGIGLGSQIGKVKIRDTARLGELFRRKELIFSLPSDAQYCFGKTFSGANNNTETGDKELGFYFIRTRGREQALVENDDIQLATQDYDERGYPCITIEFTEAGRFDWESLTGNNVKRPIGIIADNQLLSAPVVESALTGKISRITGIFTLPEAEELAILISGAALPADVEILSTETRKEEAPQRKKLLISLLAFLIGTTATFFILNSLKST